MDELEKISKLHRLHGFPSRSYMSYNHEKEPNQYFDATRKTIEKYMHVIMILENQSKLNDSTAYYHLGQVTQKINEMKKHITNINNYNLNEYSGQLDFYNRSRNLLVMSKNMNHSLECGLSNFNKFTINDHIENYTTYWTSIANKNNIDVSEEFFRINELKTNFENLDKLKLIKEIVGKIEASATVLFTSSPKPSYLGSPDTIINNYQILQDNINELTMITSSPEYEGMYQFLTHNAIPDTFRNIAIEIQKMHQKLLDNGFAFSYADQYQLDSNKSSIAQFINNKEPSKRISFTLDLNKSQKYEQLILMTDESIAIKKNDEIISVKNNLEASKIIKDVLLDYVSLKLRKKPTVSKFFINKLEDDNFKYIVYCMTAINTYLDNEDILKSNNFDLKNKLPASMNNFFEKLDDTMNKVINQHKLMKYAHSIASNKYNYLYDENSYKILEELLDNNVQESVLQDLIGKKMAAFKTPEEFNASLKKLNDSYSGFNPEALIEKANNYHAKIAVNENDVLILEINDFSQSEELGSSSWCISREEHYFDSYTDNNKRQYFIFNFNESSDSNDSMIGITLNSDGTYYTAHLKNDDEVSYKDSDDIKYYQKQIIVNNRKDYPELSPNLMKWINDNNDLTNNKIKSSII